MATGPPACYNPSVLFTVRVKPRAKRPKVVRNGGLLTVWVDAPPVDGKANERLIELLAGEFGVPRRVVRIRGRGRGRMKTVEIER